MEAKPSRLAQAGNWYLQAVDALPTGGWTRPTLCEGWTAANVLGRTQPTLRFKIRGQPAAHADSKRLSAVSPGLRARHAFNAFSPKSVRACSRQRENESLIEPAQAIIFLSPCE